MAAARRLETIQTRRHHHHPKPLPFFAFIFSFALGQGHGADRRRAPPPLWGRATRPHRGLGGAKWVGGVGENIGRCCKHRRPRRPAGRAQARRSARASATSAGGRADPPGQGARGHGRECPRINCAVESGPGLRQDRLRRYLAGPCAGEAVQRYGSAAGSSPTAASACWTASMSSLALTARGNAAKPPPQKGRPGPGGARAGRKARHDWSDGGDGGAEMMPGLEARRPHAAEPGRPPGPGVQGARPLTCVRAGSERPLR